MLAYCNGQGQLNSPPTSVIASWTTVAVFPTRTGISSVKASAKDPTTGHVLVWLSSSTLLAPGHRMVGSSAEEGDVYPSLNTIYHIEPDRNRIGAPSAPPVEICDAQDSSRMTCTSQGANIAVSFTSQGNHSGLPGNASPGKSPSVLSSALGTRDAPA